MATQKNALLSQATAFDDLSKRTQRHLSELEPIITTVSSELKWGHSCFFVGRMNTIHMRVPNTVIADLRWCGMLMHHQTVLKYQPIVHPILREMSEEEMMAIIPKDTLDIIGFDLSGPHNVVCRCKSCAYKAADKYDNTALPVEQEMTRVDKYRTNKLVAEIKAKRKYK